MITQCFVDGSYRPHGAAAAVIIYRNRKEVFRTVKPVPSNSSMAAECEAVLLAVNLCYINNYVQPVIFSDSKTLCDQFYGRTRIRNKNLAYYIFALKEIERRFPFQLKHVKRDDVYIPDQICKNWLEDAHKYFTDLKKEYES